MATKYISLMLISQLYNQQPKSTPLTIDLRIVHDQADSQDMFDCSRKIA